MKTYETKHLEITPEQLRRGDWVPGGYQVAEVKHGRKYATVLTTGGPTMRLEFGSPVTITREVETEESRARREAEAKERELAEELADYTPRVPVLLAKMTNHLSLDHWGIERLINAQAYDAVWGRWVHYATGSAVSGTLTERLDRYCVRLREELVTYASAGNSRSTSAVHNAVDAAQAAAKASFIGQHEGL